ncbi:hypothetical protein ER13_13060 [Brevundimonas sp. EAKA]|jgi:hypothetical protein|uniref:SWIM zinc finger family protein n=3 Tax=Brevundimonas TaxID=41275 RepID=A0AB37E6B4_9CAUL|nr:MULTISPECIES: DUF6880 family protein [Brevundimonas]MBU4197040.1 hypothetical protein [Alphaproteobacteria bacterium]OGN47309.1 MAG: hypothetical protein A3E24_00780 [Caulobacterales bacterium RIFCSPHIGHO2_12_FULL_68_13]KDP94296.1 hypothetical protein ER13_13060 [Brevundimonas sp. EAKA]MBA4330738.1 hypothetical protein [Brevundimonas sp.]MBU4238661.1 hypothetical protein [Alphaproteobacteria bacterium]
MARRPASPKRLNAASLASLGAERLGELLMQAADGDALLKRRLRLVLAAEAGVEPLTVELDKRLTALASARARVSWRKRPDLLRDLDMLRRAVVEDLAPTAPVAGLDRLIAWFDLFRGLTLRVKDPRGEMTAAFEAAAPDLWTVAQTALMDQAAMERLAAAIERHPLDYARWIGAAGEALTPELARAVLAGLDTSSGVRGARTAIRRLADRAEDLDLWLWLVTPDEQGSPDFAAAAARRLLTAGRVVEARQALEAALKPSAANRRFTFGRSPAAGPPPLTPAWEAASIDLLEAEGRKAEAQDLRWVLFERDLSAPALRDYLARLPDFDDVEALDRALAHAATYADFETALGFLMDWPAHREAAALVERRVREVRSPLAMKADWAARLAQKYPDAAERLLAAP